MKRGTLLLAGAALMTGALIASGYTIKEYKGARPELLNVPVTPDSMHKENAFKTEKLLDSRAFIDGMTADWTTMVPDTAGVLRLASAMDKPELHSFSTRLRAERFAKGKLVLNSTSRASVKVNGETKISKTTADSTAQKTDTPLELLPEADYEIFINILAMPDDKSAPEFSLEFEPEDEFKNVGLKSGPMLKKRVSPLSTMLGERTTLMRLSPTGKYLISLTRETYSATETQWRSSLIETATGKVLSEGINNNAEWIAGTDAYWYAVKVNGRYDIYRTDVPSMRTRIMAKGFPDDKATISPDGKYIYYYDTVDAEKESGIMRRYKSPDDRIPGDGDRSYIMRYEPETKITTILTSGGPSTMIYDFTRDGSKMLYGSVEQTPDRYPFYNYTVVEMDTRTLKSDTLINHMENGLTNAIYSPDGKELFITASPDAFGGIGANYAPHEIGNDFDGQGYIFEIATRKARAVTRDFDPAVQSTSVWNAADGKIYFLGEAGFGKNIYRLDPKSGKITELKASEPYVRDFSIGENDATWLAYIGGSFITDGRAYLMNLKNGTSRQLADPLARVTSEIEFGKMEPWKFTTKDGTVVDGWYCLPPDFDPSKKYPMIVYYYGGTSPSTASFYHLYTPQVFASRDYVVYVLNPSGTTGYGQEYSARHVNAWGKRTAEEIIEGTKHFCKEHKFVNEKKIGCIGASYGGFMTQYLQTLTDIFAAAVSHAGISNVTSYWGEGFWGYSYNSVAAAKSYPWNNPELYTQQGSLFSADKIHTPLLLLHGTVDTNVPIGESIQLFNALRILGREVEFITVKDENHVISGFDSKQVWQNTIMAWFAKWLQDDPRWWEEMFGK
ncbi:MAG: prolyl oligopeptidase family serine peptidase [Muribaculaceae bacterium]|nr:prolyl oligopeptidase family serine peptidase [Muribaculaceae bacterium]